MPTPLAVHLYRGGAEDGVARRASWSVTSGALSSPARTSLRNGGAPEGLELDRDPFLLETSVPGIFVAGDVRHGSIKRCASAVGEGSIAVQFVHQYLREV